MTTQWHCEETNDKQQLRQYLRQDSIETAYLLGDLVPPFFEHTRWFVASGSTRIQGIILLYEGLSVPCLLSTGKLDAIQALVEAFSEVWPAHGYAKYPTAHQEAFATHFPLRHTDAMWCMGRPINTPPQPFPGRPNAQVRRITKQDDLDQLLALYEQHYPGHFFEASQVERGIYMGCFVKEALVSIAGTHVYAPTEEIANLGNIMTIKEARGKGYGKQCIHALLTHLHDTGCRHVALHVKADNQAAINCYRALGFQFHSTQIDAAF